MSDFDAKALGQQLAEQFTARLDGLNISAEDYQDNATMLRDFNGIAAKMLSEDPGIETPSPTGEIALVPLDEKMIRQGLTLFSEGVYLALIKCMEMGITGEIIVPVPTNEDPNATGKLKLILMQNLAMNVYEQAKQLIVVTYGQEETPELQLSNEQLVEMMAQTADSALLYYINEHERQHGPIQIEAPAETMAAEGLQAAAPQAEAPEAAIDAPKAARPTKKAKPAASVKTPASLKGPTPHDKYGAVALLLTTIAADQRGRILQQFNAEEKELISFYSYPQHLEQNLDLGCVQGHLKRFKELLKEGSSSLSSNASQGIVQLARKHSREKLLSCLKDERPRVKRYIDSHFESGETSMSGPEGFSAPADRHHFSDILPSRVEEILYHYLLKRLEPTG